MAIAPTPIESDNASLAHVEWMAMPGIDPLERVRLARRRGSDVTRYLTGTSSRAPPIWRNTAAQDAAASLRERLEGRCTRNSPCVRQSRFGEPIWRIAAERATMTAAIERSRTQSDVAILHVELAWHDNMWLVDTITAENRP